MDELENTYNDLCRLCASKLNMIEGISIFEENNFKELHRKITSCLPIQVHISDKLPKMICLQCVYKLDELYDFREKCVHTEHLLTGLLKHNDSLRHCETLLVVHPVIPLQEVSSGSSDITLSPEGHLTLRHDRLNLQSNSIDLQTVLPSISSNTQIQRLEINLSASQNIEELGDTQGLDINEIDINQTMSLNNTNLEIIRNESLEDELEFHNVLQEHSISSAGRNSPTVLSVDDAKLVGTAHTNGITVIKCEVSVPEDEDKCSERVLVKTTQSALNSINVVISNNIETKCEIGRDYVLGDGNEKFEIKDIEKKVYNSKVFGCNDCGKMCMELGELQDHFNMCPPQTESSFCQNKLNSESQYNHCSPSQSTDAGNICNQNLLNDVNIQFIEKSPNNAASDFSNRNTHERDHQYHISEENRFVCQDSNNTDNYDICVDSDSTIKSFFNQTDSAGVQDVHTCTLCGLVCLGTINLETHLKSVHNGKQPVQRCKINFRKSIERKIEYNSDEIDDEAEPLKEFDEEFDDDEEEDDDDDSEIHNDNETEATSNIQGSTKRKKWEPKVCKECGKSYRTNYKLTEHMRKHTGEKPYKCSTCDKDFRSKIGLAQHEAKHTGQYDFACETCGKGFQCKSYLIVHQRVHSDLKPYPCTSCNSNFKTKQAMLDHMNRHLGVKPYLCEVCGRGFITKGLCKSHQRVHSGTDNRQYPCNVCQKMFVSKSYLATHLRIHTGEKPFACGICDKGFLTRVDLRIHSTMHTGEKNFVCEMCGKAFARRDALRCHRRSHTGERPYRCDICGQSFTQFSPMAIHKRLHTGERPYNCDMCTRTFVSRSTMMSHKKKHTNDTF